MLRQYSAFSLFHQNNIRFVVLIALFLITSGCTNNRYHLYRGDTRAESETAKISAWYTSNQNQHLNVLALSIDGKKTTAYNSNNSVADFPTYRVLPGKHTIKIALYLTTKSIDKKQKTKIYVSPNLTFTAKADHHYRTKAFIPEGADENSSVSFWLEDSITEDVIAGTRNQNSTLIRHRSKAVPL